jgi:hypothetical protein
MPTRTIVFLSAALAVLAALAIYLQGPGRKDRSAEFPLVFPGLEVSEVRGIAVGQGQETVSLAMTDGGWKVGTEEFRADERAVEGVLQDLSELRVEAVASRTGEREELFGLGPEEGIAVRLTGAEGSALAEFRVGREGPDRFSGYLRLEGEKRVLRVSANLETVFSRPVTGWRERRIVELDEESVEAVVLTRPGGSVLLERDANGEWSADGRPAEAGRISSFLQNIVNLRASDFADPEGAGGAFDEPAAEIVLRGEGRTLTVVAGALEEESNQRYIRTDSSETIYLVSRYSAEQLMKSQEEFLVAE